jgi:uncharacterized protein YciI
MPIVELPFTSTPERLAARPAHRVLLQRLYEEGHLVAAGPWAEDTGALLVFATERRQLDQILETDPYYHTPGVEVLGVREWAPVVGRERLMDSHA